MTVGGVLEQSLSLYQRFFWRFAATTAVVMVVLDLISALAATAGSTGGAALWGLLSIVLGLIGTFWVQGALTFAVDDVRDGRIDTTIGELYRRTQPFLVALVVAGVLAGLGIGIGLLLFIVPGLYLISRWALIVPTIVLEKRSAGEAFKRSSELTEGHRWTVLGVVVVVLIVSVVISGITRAILGIVLPTFLEAWLGSLVAHCITTPFVALAFTIMYFQLARVAEPQPATA
jgi:hypothetical protein